MPSIRGQILDAIEIGFGGPTVIVRAPVTSYVDQVKSLGGLTGMVEDDESAVTLPYGGYEITLPLNIERLETMTIDPAADFMARAAARSRQADDILTALRTTAGAFIKADRTLGGLAQSVHYFAGATFLAEENRETVGAAVQLQILYRTTIHDPNTTIT